MKPHDDTLEEEFRDHPLTAEWIVEELSRRDGHEHYEAVSVEPFSREKTEIKVIHKPNGLRLVSISQQEEDERIVRELYCMDGEGTEELVTWFLACPKSVTRVETRRAQSRLNKDLFDAVREAFRGGRDE